MKNKKSLSIILVVIILIIALGLIYILSPVNVVDGTASDVRIVYAGKGYSMQIPIDYDGADKDAASIIEAIQNCSMKKTLSRSYRETPDSRILLEYTDSTGHHTIWLYVNGSTVRAESDKSGFVGRFTGDTDALLKAINAVIVNH